MWVMLRPLGKNAWSGLVRYRNCFDTIGPYLTRSGRIYTGLTEEDAERLGKKLGRDLSPGSEFWQEWSGIRVGSKDLYLNTEDPMDELKYLFLKSHKRVASSIFERKSTANYVLINKEEEAKKANVYNKAKRRALKEFDKLSAEDVRRCLRLYGQNASTMGNEQAENVLFDLVEGNPQKFLEVWVDNKQREAQFLIESAVSKNVLRKNKNVYRYGTEVIGHNISDVIDYLEDPKNQDVKLAIMGEVGIKDEFLSESPAKRKMPEMPETEKKAKKVKEDSE